MSFNFDEAFEHTVGMEGGYVNDPTDRGGETKFGITKRYYPKLDIKALTIKEAKKIYFYDYWQTDKMNLDLFPKEIAMKLFDTSVLMGQGTARRMLQEALNLLNRVETRYPDLKVDGWVGEDTLKALAKTNTFELLKTLNGLQFIRIFNDVKKNPEQERFFAGWLKRV